MRNKQELSHTQVIKMFHERTENAKRVCENIRRVHANMETVSKEVIIKLQEGYERQKTMHQRIQALILKMRGTNRG